MIRNHRRHLSLPLLLLLLILLAACGGTTQQPRPTPTPTPTLTPGEQLLQKVATTLNSAKTVHGVFNLQLSGGDMSGKLSFEMWNEAPNKHRSVVLQSSVTEIPTGSVSVSDGKRIWQYDPNKKIVYTGAVQENQNGTGSIGGGGSQQLLNMVQSIFTRSDGTLKSSTATVNGHPAYDVYIVPQGSAGAKGANALNYEGDIFIDKETQLPIQFKLNIQGMGNITLDLPKLDLNQPITPTTFTFTAPAGTKEEPLKQGNSGGGSMTLEQAAGQAGYHLLSIPNSQSAYTLQGINALGAPGNQIYTLNYSKGNLTFTIAEGKPLADLPANGGKTITLRGTTATISSENGTTTLAWTEKGIGMRITGALSNDQAVGIASLLT